ncbi:hypothetical protein GOV14_02855 [Candidatus Pacearchaeota archaeon]|nr:hypothetical protein [Candidatus Pacearchaeota archaeon]
MKKIGITFFVVVLFFVSFISAQSLDIEMKNKYAPGETINFKVVLYDDNLQKIDGSVKYEVYNHYSEIVATGNTFSGETVNYKISEDAYRGPWKIVVTSNGIVVDRLFNVGELEKAEITLEGDTLIITNVGNVIYEKPILIYIGENHETALVNLDIGQTKRIRLTAPTGEYAIKVNDGTDDNLFEATGVALTGNAIGLQSVIKGNFFQQYPMLIIFVFVLVGLFSVVLVHRVKNKSAE